MGGIEVLAAARSRVVGTLRFEENSSLSMKLPLDTVVKGIYVRIFGSVKTTYGSGTPVAKAEGAMNSLISRIDVMINGQDVIKALSPHFLHMQQLLSTGKQTERFGVAGASIVKYPTTEGTFPFGTTGQITSIRETVYIPFEMIHAEPGLGRENTYLNLRRANSAEIKFDCKSFANLLGFGNTAPVVFSESTLQIEVTTDERQDIPMNMVFDTWKQVQKTVQFSGESKDVATELSLGNYLTGLMLSVKDGAAGSATTATGKLASNLAVTDFELRANGLSTIQKASFQLLQAKNRAVYGIDAPFAGGTSRLDGIAHINLLSRKDLSTALPTTKQFIDQLHLVLNTASNADVSYTNPVEVQIVSEELIRAARAS